MVSGLPLPALLSQALIAFVVEFDNEAERQIRHRTTDHGSSAGATSAPWLVSMVMWSNCMQFVGEEGVTVRELERLARTTTNLGGMKRWGYIVVEPHPTDIRAKPPSADWLVRPTEAGRGAQVVWRPLTGVIESRWRERFGGSEIERLREALQAVARQLDGDLPDCLPILGYDLKSSVLRLERTGTGAEVSALALPALLSRVLLAFAVEFERESNSSLAIYANVLRLLDDRGIRLAELPRMAGVSKAAITWAMGLLGKSGATVVEADPAGGRFKVVRLTPKGRAARDAQREVLNIIEGRWQERLGGDSIGELREALQYLVGAPDAGASPLFRGLQPHPENWRAAIRKPDVLPHYPMVLHRGGYPDGS